MVRAMIAGFALLRVFAGATSGPTSYPDSPTYRTKGTFLDLSLTSLDGGSMRPWGATVWLALWPSDQAIVFAQTALSILAWAALALAVAAGIRRAAVRRAVVLLLLLLASTAQLANWDLAMICESVSVSSGILALAASLWFARQPSWGRGVAFLLAALWFSMTRPNVFPTLLAWAVALLVIAVLRRQLLPWGVVAVLLVGFSLYSYVYNVRSDPSWQATWGATRTAVAYGYPVSQNNPVATDVIADMRASDAPECMVPARPEQVSGRGGTTAWVIRTVDKCPGMETWLDANWSRWWSLWLLQHPDKTLRIIDAQLPNALSPPIYTDVMAATPGPVSSLFFGSPALSQTAHPSEHYRTQPLLIWLAAAAVLAWLGRRRWRGSEWGSDLLLAATVGGTLGSAVAGVLLIQTQAPEVGREAVGLTALLTASGIVLVGRGLDRLLPGSAAGDTRAVGDTHQDGQAESSRTWASRPSLAENSAN